MTHPDNLPGERMSAGGVRMLRLGMVTPFEVEFTAIFNAEFRRLYRYLDRLSGDPELALDVAQEAFIKLYDRGALPDSPPAWLITVAMNLFRNAQSTRQRHRRLLTLMRGEAVHSDPPPSPGEVAGANDTRKRVRAALDRLPEREGQLLLLRAEGWSYRDIAAVLGLNEGSVGTMLARARRAFQEACDDDVRSR